jgi:DNA-binding transcriptional ArsR family regulator
MSPRTNIAIRERTAAPVFAALGDSTRLRIVRRLAAGDALSIASLTKGTGVTRQAVTKHLQVLDNVRLVRSSWRGRERVWELEASQLEAARRTLDVIAREWQDALGRLKSFVESQERRG